MNRVTRDPLLHFLVLGAVIFGVYRVANPESESSPENIIVTPGHIEHIATTFSRTWLRPPAPEELKGLIDDFVIEEILSREAIKLGLDRNDTVIRRRLRQKMEFIAEDFVESVEPTDKELVAYLAEHPGQFRQDQRFTFRHIYLDPDQHLDTLEDDLLALRATLARATDDDASQLGDRIMLPHAFEDEPQRSVAAQFGDDFAASLGELELDRWAGPIRSGYGVHLVFIDERTEGRLPPLDEIRTQVKRELLAARREEANRGILDALLTQYNVTIQWPDETRASADQTAALHR